MVGVGLEVGVARVDVLLGGLLLRSDEMEWGEASITMFDSSSSKLRSWESEH